MIQDKIGIGRVKTPERQIAGRTAPEEGPIALIKAVSAAVRRKAMPLGIWVFVCFAGAFLYASSLPPVYTAAATLILETPRQIRTGPGVSISDATLDLTRVDSELQVIRSERMQRLVFEALGLANHPEMQPAGDGSEATPTPADAASTDPNALREREAAFARFRDRFGARRIGQSYVIEIYYSSAYPELAARIANAGASAYLLQSVSFKLAAASGGAEFVQSRLDALENEVAAATAAVRDGTLPDIQIPNADARVIGAALTPLSPSAPRVKLIAALGGMLGLLGGLFAIALGSALDRRVGNGRQLAAECDLDLLAIIPKTKNPAGGDAEGPFSMALRDMRTAVDLSFGSDVQTRGRSIALVSWEPGAGCSTLVMSLAHMMHNAGLATVIVDGDMRGGARGLTWRYRQVPSKKLAGGLTVLSAGGSTLLPATVLKSLSESIADTRDPSVTELFRQIHSWGDVLIDLPPLSESADARALARQADAVILVATPESLLEDLVLARRQLEQSGVQLLGVAINDTGHVTLPSRLWSNLSREVLTRFHTLKART